MRPQSKRAIGDEVEGYLLWRARVDEAGRRAREFVQVMDWLTAWQRMEIEQHYMSDNLQKSKDELERIAARCSALQDEYEGRYARLKRRCVGLALGFCVVAGTSVSTLWLLL